VVLLNSNFPCAILFNLYAAEVASALLLII
jgi:hypothetical protein